MKIKFYIIIIFILNIKLNSMVNSNLKLNNLPNELIALILKKTVKDYINKRDNLFKFYKDFNKEDFLNYINNIRLINKKINNIFKEYLINIIEKYQKKRFNYLINKLKLKINKKNDFKDLNLNLKSILDKENISEKDLKKSLKLILAGADVNLKNKFGNSLLITSILNNDREISEILLSLNSDIDLLNNNGENSLIASVKSKNNDIFKSIFLNSSNFEVKNVYGHNVLHTAILYNKEFIVKKLLKENKIDVNSITDNGSSSLILAYYLENKDLVNLLIDFNIDISFRDIKYILLNYFRGNDKEMSNIVIKAYIKKLLLKFIYWVYG